VAKRPSLREAAGLGKPIGKARRYPVLGTDKTISYNEGRHKMSAFRSSRSFKTRSFEQALARTKNPERARVETGLSKRWVGEYRKSFKTSNRGGASPWNKRGRFNEARFHRTHSFVDKSGQVRTAGFGGTELIKAQDYRTAWAGRTDGGGTPGLRKNAQADLDAWLAKYPPGSLIADDGAVYWPETDATKIQSRLKRMSPRQRKRFAKDISDSGEKKRDSNDR
jgi:hypothetical protein